VTDTARRVVIITGGSRGIGREVATRFAGAAYAVVVNYADNKTGADDVVAAIDVEDAHSRPKVDWSLLLAAVRLLPSTDHRARPVG